MAIYGGKILKLGKSHSFSIRTHLQLSGFLFSHFCQKQPTLTPMLAIAEAGGHFPMYALAEAGGWYHLPGLAGADSHKISECM